MTSYDAAYKQKKQTNPHFNKPTNQHLPFLRQANWLTLIHSEYPHPWDPLFRKLGFGTAADHHVHHKLFKYNYGHLFMYWDMAAGTYKDPSTVKYFNVGV